MDLMYLQLLSVSICTGGASIHPIICSYFRYLCTVPGKLLLPVDPCCGRAWVVYWLFCKTPGFTCTYTCQTKFNCYLPNYSVGNGKCTDILFLIYPFYRDFLFKCNTDECTKTFNRMFLISLWATKLHSESFISVNDLKRPFKSPT